MADNTCEKTQECSALSPPKDDCLSISYVCDFNKREFCTITTGVTPDPPAPTPTPTPTPDDPSDDGDSDVDLLIRLIGVSILCLIVLVVLVIALVVLVIACCCCRRAKSFAPNPEMDTEAMLPQYQKLSHIEPVVQQLI